MADTMSSPIPTRRLPLSTMLRLRGLHLDRDDEAGGEGDEGEESTSFVDRMVDKYERQDREQIDREDGVAVEDEDDDEDVDDADDEEHPDPGTSADDPDGDDAESDDDSSDDDEEHPDDDEESDSSDDDDAGGDDEGDEDDEESDDEARAALATKGADLSLQDVPKEYRGIITKKLRGIDGAFTRLMQEQSDFRKERSQLRADRKFQDDNPEIVVIELLEKHPDLFDKVNEQLEKNQDKTVAEAFKVVVEKKRSDAAKAIEAEAQGAERVEARIVEVETLTARHARAAGIPEWIADQAVGNVVSAALREGRDVKNEEVSAAVKAVAKQYLAEQRGKRREQSRDRIRGRAEHRKTAPPAVRRPGTATAPAAGSKRREASIDWRSEDSRVNRILESTRRIKPGGR